MPCAARAGSTCSWVWIAGSRTVRSSSSTWRLVRPVAHRVRPVRVGRQVHVGDRDDPAGRRLDEHVHAVAARRVDDREARDDVVACARVPAERLGDDVGVALGLLQTRRRRRRTRRMTALDPQQGLRAAVGDRAERLGGRDEVVAAVEDVLRHHLERDRVAPPCGDGRRTGRRRGGGCDGGRQYDERGGHADDSGRTVLDGAHGCSRRSGLPVPEAGRLSGQ